MFIFQEEVGSERHVKSIRAERHASVPGWSNKDFPGAPVHPRKFPKLDPYMQLVEGEAWLMSAFPSNLGERHEFGTELVCWQDTAFRNVDSGVMPKSATQLSGSERCGKSRAGQGKEGGKLSCGRGAMVRGLCSREGRIVSVLRARAPCQLSSSPFGDDGSALCWHRSL